MSPMPPNQTDPSREERLDCEHPLDAVYGNEFNKVVQCHRCGAVFIPAQSYVQRLGFEGEKVS